MKCIVGALTVAIVFIVACESEKIEYHCGISSEDIGFGDVFDDVKDIESSDTIRSKSNMNDEETLLLDAEVYDINSSDVLGYELSKDILSGKPCNTVGVSKECGIDESCYPYVECAGLCRRCGTATLGSNCEVHSDCKCGMACLALSDKELKCYKICNSNLDCPAGQTCTDGWGIYYQHEYYKICKGVNKQQEDVN